MIVIYDRTTDDDRRARGDEVVPGQPLPSPENPEKQTQDELDRILFEAELAARERT